MAVITTTVPPRFDPLNAYVRVRLAQGVPIVDADVNEREDIDMFELRAFLKWFVGDGVPEGNDGFRIVESTTSRANNLRISSGFGTATNALTNAGRCLVNGLDVMIKADEEFTNQELFETKPNIASVEARLKSPRILAAAMNSGVAGTLHVWLDVWDALVTPSDEPALILPGLGTESCSRERRYWAVRVRTSNLPPTTGDAEFSPGHSYYRIAEITRRAADPNVNQADILDLREQRLLVPPSTIIPDLFNVSVLEYRRGNGRAAISFREAINALIRGEVPGTPELVIAPAPTFNDLISRGIFFLGGTIVLTWNSDRVGRQVFATTLDLANPGAGFGAPQQLTSGTDHFSSHAVPLLGGDLFVVFETLPAPNPEHVRFKRGPLTGPGAIATVADQDVSTSGTARERRPVAVRIGSGTGERVVVMWYDQTAGQQRWKFRLRDVFGNTWVGPEADLSATQTTAFELHAARDSTDTIWAAFRVETTAPLNEIQVVRLQPGNPPVVETPSPSTLSTTNLDKQPFVLVDRTDVPWVFWMSTTTVPPISSSIMYSRRDPAGWTTPLAIPGLPPGNYTSNNPAAVIDADGAIWVFWDSFLSPSGNKDIWYARLNPVSGVWTGSRPSTGTSLPDQTPHVLKREVVPPDGVIWLFWNRDLGGGQNELFFRRLVTTV